MLALLGGVFGGAYIVTGGFARRELSTVAYTSLCYGVCGVLLLVVCLVSGNALTRLRGRRLGADRDADRDRPAARALADQPRAALDQPDDRLRSRRCSRSRGAALIAAFALGQTPPAETVPALALLLAGTALVISARERAPAETP